MKILFITRPIAPPWNEGSKNFVLGLAKNLKKHEVHLLSSPGVSGKSRHVIFEPIFPRLRQSLMVPLSQKLRILIRMFKNDGIDIIHIVFNTTILSSKMMRITLFFRFSKPKTIQTVLSNLAGPTKLKRMVFADYVMVLSRFMEKRLKDAGIKNVVRISPGIDLKEFSPGNSLAAKKKFGFDGKKVVLFPGGFLEKLGALVFAKSAKEIIAVHPDTMLVFACRKWGVPVEEVSVKEKIWQIAKKHGFEKNVVFLLEIESIRELIDASDVLVFTPEISGSKFDYPLVLLEAMAMEKPIVISDLAPLNEIFESKEGIKVKPSNPTEISNAVVSLLSNPAKAQEIGRSAAKYAKQNFDIVKSANALSKLYERISVKNG